MSSPKVLKATTLSPAPYRIALDPSGPDHREPSPDAGALAVGEATSRIHGGLASESELSPRDERSAARDSRDRRTPDAESLVAHDDRGCRVFEKGFAAGRDEAERALRRQIDLVQTLLLQAREAGDQLVREAQPLVIQLALTIAEKVLKQEIRRHRRWLVTLIEEALRHVEGTTAVTVALNPEDHRVVTELWPPSDGRVIAFVANPDIPPAGCVIETDLGRLDVGLETQLETIAQSLRALALEAGIRDQGSGISHGSPMPEYTDSQSPVSDPPPPDTW